MKTLKTKKLNKTIRNITLLLNNFKTRKLKMLRKKRVIKTPYIIPPQICIDYEEWWLTN